VWWRPARDGRYRRLTGADVAALDHEFARAGRRAVLSS
jgi:hypothetical protein